MGEEVLTVNHINRADFHSVSYLDSQIKFITDENDFFFSDVVGNFKLEESVAF